MAEELKACPFCGSSNAEVFAYGMERENQHPCDRSHAVSCEDCGGLGPEIAPRSAAIDNWNTRDQLPSQGGEAVEVLTTWHPDSRSYEEQIVRHDTKGSRKALGAMNAKLRAKVGRLERELATIKQSLTVEPVAYAAFADNGNIRMWCRSAIGMCELFDAHGNKAVPLYTHPADQVEDGVVVSRELLERIVKRGMRLPDDTQRQHLGELRALLAKP